MTLKVHSYESMGTYDGPGLRLVVFLQGCPFRCLYCANPDTIPYAGGTETDISEILQMAIRQKPFFGKRGGVTFSGGEPTLQAKALIPLVEQLHENGINVCLDSNGGIWNSDIEKLLSITDLVLLDVKEFNPQRHQALTGRSNSQTLRTAAWLQEHGKPFWLRYVLVPGYSDYEEDIRALGEHFGNTASIDKNTGSAGDAAAETDTEAEKSAGQDNGYSMIQKVEILPYHTLGESKYEALGQEYRLKDVPLNTREQLERAESLFKEYFSCVVVN